jgi:tetratricopeptide (TPR) repeat protein
MNRHLVRNSKLISLRLYIATALLVVGSNVATSSSAHSQQSPSASKKTPALSVQAQRSLELNEQGVTAIKARDFSRAESLFSEALRVDGRNITAVYNLAGMYITNKKEGQAVALLQKYTLEFPKDAGLHARLGDAYFGSQDPKSAIAAYEKSLQLDPKNPSVPVRLATLYTMSKKIDKAAKMYEQVLKQNPRDLQSMQNLSSIYLALNKPQQAIATAKKALQISATPELYVTLGNAYQDLKDPRNALISFQRAQELGYKDPNLGKVIEDLAKITSENKRT